MTGSNLIPYSGGDRVGDIRGGERGKHGDSCTEFGMLRDKLLEH